MGNPVLEAEQREIIIIKELASKMGMSEMQVASIIHVLRNYWRASNRWRWDGYKFEKRND